MLDIDTLGEQQQLLEGIRTTRAIRRLKSDPVPVELVRKVCQAGSYAPSGGNRQPWFFVAVMDQEKRAFIAQRYKSAFAEYIAPGIEAAKNPEYPEVKKRNMRAAIHLAENMHQVPVHLFVAGWTRHGRPQDNALYPAIQNILLACRAVGLGASLTTAHLAFGDEIDEFIGLSKDTPSCALIPIGWPIGKYGRPTRRPIDDCFFIDEMPASARAKRR
ncbi:MAG: nitroreductase family protein [Pseudomonadales bacterium]|nr:nitroreductase family protein [Pseudomonadales bacterium]